jgi:DNA-binding NarL/FixJ family response regulator
MHMETQPPGANPPARVLIVDDSELAREGLRSLLSGEYGLCVVGEAGSGREALALCRGLRPDLVLMDVRLPELDGLATTRAIKEEFPGIAVLIITMYEDPDYLLEAIKSGATGFVLKGAPKSEIVAAAQRVLRGESMLDSRLTAQLLHRLADQGGRTGSAPALNLTAREREVLFFLSEGKTNREIAEALFVSLGTVKTHVEHIIAKLGAADRTQAAVRGVQLGLLSRDRVAPGPQSL